ncbi:MAG: purine-binding chemotaxis protein CheW [Desulfobacteraceae bacterium]|nr:purine-binding chemotaxis protein CheW [Desulfobacteraceae bacterium]MBC2754120.1 purine-binding chemotaxis protein CheW [Desulfobacteraceae bacterium]
MDAKPSQSDPIAEEILKKRAQKLAQPISIDNKYLTKMAVVEFRISHEIYALELKRIRIIHPLKELTFIPGTPDFIRGVINLRGEIISVVDLKVFFDLPDQGFTNLSQVIILTSDEMEFGILADEILGVAEISKNDIQPSLPTLTGVRQEYLKGVTGNGMVVLDDEKLLSDEKMCINL